MGSNKTIVTEERTMKKLLLAASAALVAATPTFAGDLPVRRSQPIYAPEIARSLFNWTGFYVGGHAGWGWGSAAGVDPDGYLLGLQAGYNYQLPSNLVLGAEADISYSGIDNSSGGTSFEVDYLGTLRARFGYTMDRVMFYGTGGFAYGRGELTRAGLSNSQTHLGWTIGGGVEAMIAPNISTRFEYLYVDLGSENYKSAAGTARVGFDTSVLRAGMNYKF
jgi:outer membrane immunogenic protein